MTWCGRAQDGVYRRSMPTRPARARHHRRNVAWAVALTAALLLSATACGGDDDPGPTADATTTTTTAKSTTTVPPEKLPAGHFIDLHLPADLTAEEKEVAEAYRDASEAFARTLRDPSGDHPELPTYYSHNLLPETEGRLKDLRDAGQAVRRQNDGKLVISVVDTNITPAAAGLLVCLSDDSETYKVATGEQLKAAAPAHQVVVKMVDEGGRWKVEASPSRKASDGTERSCAE